jgi:hypothetical protein
MVHRVVPDSLIADWEEDENGRDNFRSCWPAGWRLDVVHRPRELARKMDGTYWLQMDSQPHTNGPENLTVVVACGVHRKQDVVPNNGRSAARGNHFPDNLEHGVGWHGKVVAGTFSRHQFQKVQASSSSGAAGTTVFGGRGRLDDFIVTADTREVLEYEVKPLLENFLRRRGLELLAEKTKITHVKEGI